MLRHVDQVRIQPAFSITSTPKMLWSISGVNTCEVGGEVVLPLPLRGLILLWTSDLVKK